MMHGMSSISEKDESQAAFFIATAKLIWNLKIIKHPTLFMSKTVLYFGL